MEILWYLLCKHIPFETILLKKESHPCINDRCETIIRSKNAAEGTSLYEEKRVECARILKEEYGRYVTKLKEELAKLPKGSKKCWKLNRQLLNKKKQTSSIPPLKYEGKWLHGAKDKADLFARTF